MKNTPEPPLWPQFSPRLPSVGVVVGTYGALPYIHLHLGIRARLYPEMPFLVHDDCSPQRDELAALCARYDADFISSTMRNGHYGGDTSAFMHGLCWAPSRGVNWLVKFSRRFVPLYDFRLEVARNAVSFPFPTQTGYHVGNHHEFGFTTSAIAMHVGAWSAPIRSYGGRSTISVLADKITAWNGELFEAWMHDRARTLAQAVSEQEICFPDLNAARLREVIQEEGRPTRWDGYAHWPILGGQHGGQTVGALFHSNDEALRRYELLSNALQLPYNQSHFAGLNSHAGL